MPYPPEYYQAWDSMIATGRYWAMAPIHHGVFESAWKRALELAATVIDRGGSAEDIRALSIWTEPGSPSGGPSYLEGT